GRIGDGLHGTFVCLDRDDRGSGSARVPNGDDPIVSRGEKAVRLTHEGHGPNARLVAAELPQLLATDEVPKLESSVIMSRERTPARDCECSYGAVAERDSPNLDAVRSFPDLQGPVGTCRDKPAAILRESHRSRSASVPRDKTRKLDALNCTGLGACLTR